MAYINKEETQTARKIVNKIAKEYGFKFSTSMKNNSSLNISLMKSDDLIQYFEIDSITKKILEDFNYKNISFSEFQEIFPKYLQNTNYQNTLRFYDTYSNFAKIKKGEHSLIPSTVQGNLKTCLEKIETEVKKELGYYDDSDIQTDYFDTAFYFNLSIGKWDKSCVIS